MKKFVCLISIVLLLNICVAAQDKQESANPNFTGIWIFDAKNSEVAQDFKRDFKDYTWIIVHIEPEIKITRTAVFKNEKVTADLILYSDKRGEKNYPYFRVKTQESISKSFWKKGVLISESKEKIVDSPIWLMDGTEKFILSEDKKTLTVNSTSRIVTSGRISELNGWRSARWVFRKKE
jgi:hypothetical protein